MICILAADSESWQNLVVNQTPATQATMVVLALAQLGPLYFVAPTLESTRDNNDIHVIIDRTNSGGHLIRYTYH